jgi:ATP-dependent DNA helicase RecG
LFLNLYPDRFEVVNPGRLPLGVTPKTMLHASRRRNNRMATIFHDLRLMEREGSGFDLIYDVQLSQGRPIPLPKEGIDSVSVTVERRVKRPEVVRMMADADARFQLRQRERIVLGLLAASEGLTARELANQLELDTPDDVRAAWLGRLLELELVQSTGKTQATRYFVNPVVLKGQGLDGKTTLKRIEPHRLRALIVEDLRRYPGAASGDINRRVGVEVPYRTLKRAIDELVEQGSLRFVGLSRGRRYWLVEQLEK